MEICLTNIKGDRFRNMPMFNLNLEIIIGLNPNPNPREDNFALVRNFKVLCFIHKRP